MFSYTIIQHMFFCFISFFLFSCFQHISEWYLPHFFVQLVLCPFQFDNYLLVHVKYQYIYHVIQYIATPIISFIITNSISSPTILKEKIILREIELPGPFKRSYSYYQSVLVTREATPKFTTSLKTLG